MLSLKIEPRIKKSFLESYIFERNGVRAHLEIGWRWGSVWLQLSPDEYLPSMDDIIEFEGYENWELNDCWDSCWEDWTVLRDYSKEDSVQAQEERARLEETLQRAWNDEGWEAIEGAGWTQTHYDVIIHNEWCIVDVKKESEDESTN